MAILAIEDVATTKMVVEEVVSEYSFQILCTEYVCFVTFKRIYQCFI